MTRVASGLGLVLHPAVVYLSPSNRRCRWVGSAQDECGRQVERFAYDGANGRRVDSDMADGFTLTAGNVRFMRRVA